MSSLVPALSITSSIVPSTTPINPLKNVLLIGQKLTGGIYTPPANGYTDIDYYVPTKLPSFTNGGSAVQYISNLGINTKLGISFQYNFGEQLPSSITNNGSLTVIQWNTVPYSFAQLTNFNLSGTLVQGQITAIVKSAQIISIAGNQVAQITVYGNPAFTLLSAMELNAENNIIYPDPNNSDPIGCMVWDFYQTYLSATPSIDGTSPTAYISVLADRDTSISPNPTPFALAAPTSVTVNADTSVTLSYTKTTAYIQLESGEGDIELENSLGNIELENGGVSNLANFGYLPQSQLGQSTLIQGTTTATYGGYEDLGSVIEITAFDVTGTFTTITPINVSLDPTQNAGAFLDGITIDSAVMQFSVATANDFVTHADFYNLITILNGQNQALLNHYGTLGVAGNITSLPYQAPTLPILNDWNNVLISYPYYIKFGDIPYETDPTLDFTMASGRIGACVAYLVANGDVPYNGLTNVNIKHLPISSTSKTTSYSKSVGGTGDLAIQQGWLPLVPSTIAGVQLLQSNTSLIFDGLNIPDTEYRYISIKKRNAWLNNQVTNLYNSTVNLPNNAGVAYMTNTFLSNLRAGIISILTYGQNAGMFQNVSQFVSLITVVQNPTIPNNVLITIPQELVPQINQGTVQNFIYSSLTPSNS